MIASSNSWTVDFASIAVRAIRSKSSTSAGRSSMAAAAILVMAAIRSSSLRRFATISSRPSEAAGRRPLPSEPVVGGAALACSAS